MLLSKVPGYEDRYLITGDGVVLSNARSLDRSKYYLMKLSVNPKGYTTVNLSKDSGYRTRRVHQLVAQAFIPNPHDLPQLNHINGIKTDNRKENLEWCTASHNSQHAWDIGLVPRTRKPRNVTV